MATINATIDVKQILAQINTLTQNFNTLQVHIKKSFNGNVVNSFNNQIRMSQRSTTTFARIFETNLTRISNTTNTTNTHLQHLTASIRNINASANQFRLLVAGYISKLFANLTAGALESASAFEKTSASLSVWTGSMETAKAKFWELNALEDETLIATDKLAQAYIKLGNFNLNNSSESIKNLAKVATGLNVDLSTVVDSLDKASQGQFKSLKQLGIQAEQVGDKIKLTYQGQTQTIQANTAELQKYFDNLANSKFDSVLEAKTQTLAGAIGRVGNAWGSLQTVIFASDAPIGQFLARMSNKFADFINDLVGKFQNGQVKKQIETFINSVNQGVSQFATSVSKTFTTLFSWLNANSSETTKDLELTWGNWFVWFQDKLVWCVSAIEKTLNYMNAPLKAAGEYLGSQVYKALNGELLDAINPLKQIESLNNSISNTYDELESKHQEINKALKLSEDTVASANIKYKESLKVQNEEIKLLDTKAEKIKGMAIGSPGNNSGVSKATDNMLQQMQAKWVQFYENIRQIGLSDVEKENERYNSQLAYR